MDDTFFQYSYLKYAMNPHPPSSRPRIIPSSTSIHTSTSDQGGRTFYYSSLIIDHDSRNFGSKFRWKVHLGDIVAVAKNNSKEDVRDLIESWEPNHYTGKSPDWKVGLVVALRKRITRHTPSHGFECHIQWLDKAMDLDEEEMKSSKIKSTFRSYNDKTKINGSQMPHVLINRPGDYGIVSMLPTTSSIDQEYDILLPVTITIRTQQDFVSNGIKEGEESQYALQFCCLKIRLESRRSLGNGEESSTAVAEISFVSEPNPDAWIELNPPSIEDEEGSSNEVKNVALLNKIPEPLLQAWKGWIQASSAIDSCRGGGSGNGTKSGTPSTLSSKDKDIDQQQISLLRDALMRGWSQSRRERYNKAVLLKEEQRREIIEEGIGTERINDTTTITTKKRTINTKKSTKSGSCMTKDVATKKRKKDDGRNSTDSLDETTTGSKRLRFSADTKKPSSSQRISNISQKPSKTKKTSMKNASSRLQSSTATISGKKNANTKNGRQTNMEGNNDDGAASTTTRDTHSTDTTIATRGAGLKVQGKKPTGTIGTRYKKIRDDSNCDSDDSEHDDATSAGRDSIALPNVADALDNWNVDSAFMLKTGPFYTDNHSDYFKQLRMTIPSGDPAIGSLLDKDEIGSLDHNRHGDDQYLSFQINIGSVVAIHYEDSISTTNSWAPFLVPFGLAQVTNIFKERNDNNDDDDDSWKLSIKWFYRYPELQSNRRTDVLTSMNKKDGLVETYEYCDCSVKEVLPANIELTSDIDLFTKLPRQTRGSDGFPIVRMLCQHLERSLGKITRINDWSYNYHSFLQNLSPPLKETLPPGPLKRAVEKMPKLVKSMYNSWLMNNICSKTTASNNSSNESTVDCLNLAPKMIGTLYEQWGNKFVYAVCLSVKKIDLHKQFRLGSNNRWTLAVGHVIPVRHKHGSVGCFPFKEKWLAAQIVSLYQTELGAWMMQIRWFCRFQEILKQHKASIQHLNKSHVVFETEVFEHLSITAALPGRIILSSTENKQKWGVVASDVTGLPLIPRLCTQFCWDEEIEPSRDWTNYDFNLSKIPSGLSRGLLLKPTNRQNKEWILILSRFYIKATKNRSVDPDHSSCNEDLSIVGNDVAHNNNKLIGIPFNPDDIRVTLGSHLLAINLDGGVQDFYKCLDVVTPIPYLVEPTIEIRRKKKHSFECMVGDIVCYFDQSASLPGDYTSMHCMKHPWYPFKIPYSYGQVLSIFRQSTTQCVNDIKVEVRRFYKSSELSDEAKEFLPLHLETNREEIFESNELKVDLDAKCLLGIVEIFLGNHTSSGNEKNHSKRQNHIVSCRCKFLYLKSFQRLQPIYWSSLSPIGWLHGLRQRGFQRSKFLQQHKTLREAMENDSSLLLTIGNICDLLIPSKKMSNEGSCVRLGKQIQSLQSRRLFYAEVSLIPQWSLFCASDIFDRSESRSWVLKVGDIVAIQDFDTSQNEELYPFTVPHYPGQVISIFNENSELDSLRFEIRRLKFVTEANGKSKRRQIADSRPPVTILVESKYLLGPIVLYCSGTYPETDLSERQIELPLSEFLASTKSLNTEKGSVLALSNMYTIDEIKKFRQLVRNQVEIPHHINSSDHPLDTSHRGRNPGETWCHKKPFRVDSSQLKAFYAEMTLIPQCKTNAGAGRYEQKSAPKIVRMGDTIQARFEGSKRLPYDCNWALAEIISIFEEFTSQEELELELGHEHNLDPKDHRKPKIKVEIRWFYERQDISMVASSSAEETSELVEVYETDHCQVMDACTAILGGYAKLVENFREMKKDDNEDPNTQHFVCTKFWSTKRRSLIPCSGAIGRKKRGLIHSKYLNKSSSSRKAFTEYDNISSNWKDSMINLIGKLTLKDASKNAYEGGEALLVGREKEISNLLTFFRAAFSKDPTNESFKSSLFLAGPPGV